MLTTAITNENIRTFDHVFQQVLVVAPHLAFAVFVLLLDGDKATWYSAPRYFKNVVIILCAYHATQNFKRRLGCLCKDGKDNVLLPLANKVRWIQCQENDCGKWGKISHDAVIPTDFTITFVTCECPQDETCQ